MPRRGLKKSSSLCHDVDLNVDIAMARSRESGEMSALQALEPRALIPGTHSTKIG